METQQAVGITLRQLVVGARGEHHAPRDVVLLDGAARMRADLHHEHVLDVQLRGDAEQHGGDAGGVGVGQLGEIAGPHQHLGVGTLAPHLRITLERLHEAEIDRIEHGVDEIVHAPWRRAHPWRDRASPCRRGPWGSAPGSRRPGRRYEASSSLRLSRKSAPALPPRSSSSALAESTLDLVALLLQRARPSPRDAETACREGSRDRSRWRLCATSPRRASGSPRRTASEASTISAKIWMSYLVMSEALRARPKKTGMSFSSSGPRRKGTPKLLLRRSRSARQRPGSMILSASTGFGRRRSDDVLGHQRRDLHADIQHLPVEVRDSCR